MSRLNAQAATFYLDDMIGKHIWSSIAVDIKLTFNDPDAILFQCQPSMWPKSIL
jgi:hypothetical protein